MIEKQNKHILVKGPPGLIVRKSRDSLRMFGVRGDPELNEPGNLTGFENLSGIIPSSLRATEGSVATVAPSLRATAGSMAICRKTGYYNNVYSSMQMDCFGLLRRPRNDGQTSVVPSLRATAGSVATVASSLRATEGSVAICQILKQVQDDKYDEDDMKQILNRVQEDKKKDCVRVDVDSEMFPENWSKLGFHRAPGMMERNLTGFENLSGLIPKKVPIFIGSKALPGRSRNDGQTTKSSLRATEGSVETATLSLQVTEGSVSTVATSLRAIAESVAICQQMNMGILNQVQDDMKKDCVRMDDFPMGLLRNWNKQEFHRAPTMMKGDRRRETGEGSVVTVAPSLRATEGSVAIYIKMRTYNNKV